MINTFTLCLDIFCKILLLIVSAKLKRSLTRLSFPLRCVFVQEISLFFIFFLNFFSFLLLRAFIICVLLSFFVFFSPETKAYVKRFERRYVMRRHVIQK